jgi:hypothetical protein
MRRLEERRAFAVKTQQELAEKPQMETERMLSRRN